MKSSPLLNSKKKKECYLFLNKIRKNPKRTANTVTLASSSSSGSSTGFSGSTETSGTPIFSSTSILYRSACSFSGSNSKAFSILAQASSYCPSCIKLYPRSLQASTNSSLKERARSKLFTASSYRCILESASPVKKCIQGSEGSTSTAFW